jgi:hypothetical protein
MWKRSAIMVRLRKGKRWMMGSGAGEMVKSDGAGRRIPGRGRRIGMGTDTTSIAIGGRGSIGEIDAVREDTAGTMIAEEVMVGRRVLMATGIEIGT